MHVRTPLMLMSYVGTSKYMYVCVCLDVVVLRLTYGHVLRVFVSNNVNAVCESCRHMLCMFVPV